MKEQRVCTLKCDKTCQEGPGCNGCGWFAPEIRRRKALLLILGEDGLMRKIIKYGRKQKTERSL